MYIFRLLIKIPEMYFQVIIGTKVGSAKHMRIMPGGALEQESISAGGRKSFFVGSKLDEHRGAFILDHPMDKGYVVDSGWDAMEKIWEVSDRGYHDLLLISPCVLHQPSLNFLFNLLSFAACLFQIVFEC